MKFFAIFLFAACMQVSATGFSQKISLSQNDVSLKKVFKEIEAQSGYHFFYKDKLLKKAGNVSIHLSGATVEEALDQCFKDLPLSYSILDKIVVVKAKKPELNPIPALEALSVTPLQIITGTIKDEKGVLLAGVSVIVKGTNKGTSTNTDGSFSIDANVGDVLEFTNVGYKNKSITIVSNTNFLSVVMEIEVIVGNEVVVVGYGTQKRSQLIGSVSQVDAKDINNRSVPQLSQSLTGQMPGVTAIQRSGQPGASGEDIQIRGVGSFGASTAPLILLDGIPISSMDDVNPNDVQSISVLKDASSAAIYGARASNGVILVTTKLGSKSEKLRVSYNGYVSTQRATEYPKFVNSSDYAMLQNEAQPGSWTDAQIDSFKLGTSPNYPNTNWIDLVFKKGTLMTGQNLSIANSSKSTDYFLSFGYLYQNGIVMKNNYNRYNVRLNMTNRISKRLTLTSHLAGEQDNDYEPAAPATLDFTNMLVAISQVIRFPSIYPNKLSNGDWGTGVVGKGTPVSYLENESFYKSRSSNLTANERLDWQIITGLKASLIAGYSELNFGDQAFQANQRLNENITLGPGNLTQDNSNNYYKTLQELIQYDKNIQKHKVSLLLGHSFEDSYSGSTSEYRSGFNTNLLTQIDAGDVSTQTNNGTASEWALDSYFGRLQYNYADKYLLEGDIRRDGSSRFPIEKRYATFPAVAVGWRVSQENFIKNNDNFKWLNDLKLKASYGTLGNQAIGNYPYQNILSGGYNYTIGGNIAPGVAISSLADSAIHWESTRTKDVGIEATVLGNKLTLGATYFDKYTYDILVSPGSSVSQVLGFQVGPQNSGKLKNSGWEFTLEHKNRIGQFSYDVNVNFSIINNKVVDLGVGDIKQPNGLIGNGSSLFIGYPVNIYYGYVANGLFADQNQITNAPDQTAVNPTPQPGDIAYKDISGPDGKPDGRITAAYDRTVLGSTIPKYTYGANIHAGYKNFDLNVLLQGVAHVSGYISGYAGLAFFNNGNVQQWQMDDRWTPSNPNPNAILHKA